MAGIVLPHRHGRTWLFHTMSNMLEQVMPTKLTVIPSTTTSCHIVCIENQQELVLRLDTKVHVQKGWVKENPWESTSNPNDLTQKPANTSRPFSELHKCHGLCLVDDTVGGRNPAPVDRYFIPLFATFIRPRWCRISSINSTLDLLPGFSSFCKDKLSPRSLQSQVIPVFMT